MKTTAINLRKGHVIDRDGKLYVILKTDILQPGKGASVVQIEMRDLKSGTKDNVRYRTQETVEKAFIESADFQFLFAEGDSLNFMNTETYDQITVERDVVGQSAVFLQEGMVVKVELHETTPVNVELPDQVTLEITESEPVVKGQTASSSYKPAILENGEKVMVPPHIGAGTRVVVKTEDGSYVERAKD